MRAAWSAAMYLPDFLDGFDRLVAFDAETTGKRTPDAEFIRKQPFAWKAPGVIIEVGFVEMLRDGEGWRKGATWGSRVNPDGPIDPEAIKIRGIRPGDLKNAARFPTILPRVKDLIGESPIVAHAYKNERDFLDYEFAHAKVIPSGKSAYDEQRYICTQILFA
jgi:DNA polymerase III subunit epsilon